MNSRLLQDFPSWEIFVALLKKAFRPPFDSTEISDLLYLYPRTSLETLECELFYFRRTVNYVTFASSLFILLTFWLITWIGRYSNVSNLHAWFLVPCHFKIKASFRYPFSHQIFETFRATSCKNSVQKITKLRKFFFWKIKLSQILQKNTYFREQKLDKREQKVENGAK